MIKKVDSTGYTKSLITNVINDFRTNKPMTKHIDYNISVGKKSSLLTDENSNQLRNVSIIYLKGIQAAIGNNTGDILITRKPSFLSSNKTLEKIMEFLAFIQPKNLDSAKVLKSHCDSFNFAKPEAKDSAPDFIKSIKTLYLKGNKVEKTVIGSNSTFTFECIDEYKKL